MIALHGYDPSIVEDSYFKSFVRRLNPDFQVPSRAAIEDICDDVQDDADRVLQSALERNSSKVNVVVDRTETALGSVIHVACHFIDDDWNRRSTIVHLAMDITEDMETMPQFVRGYDLGNTEHVELLGEIISKEFRFGGETFSRSFGAVGDLENYLMGTKQYILYHTTPYDELQTVASCLYDSLENEPIELGIDWQMANYSVTRQEREQFYSQNGLDHLLPYDKEWYSCYCSMLFLLRSDSSFHFLIEQMCHVWGEIHRAIKTISDPNHPTSNIVLRELFKVRETLQSQIAEASGREKDLYDALVKAEEILVERLEYIYLEWSIPLVLDPRYKLKYTRFVFSRAFSSEVEEYISKITGKIKHLFLWFSGHVSETDGEDHDTEMTSAASAHQLDQAWGEHRRSLEATKTELDRYLEGPLVDETDDFDILNWWKLNSYLYPTLALMARAALAMPTCRKPSSELMSQITSRIRGYSKGKLRHTSVLGCYDLLV
jgi:hypothetical protein